MSKNKVGPKKERGGRERKGKGKEGKGREGKERKGKERKGKERKGKERKGKEEKELAFFEQTCTKTLIHGLVFSTCTPNINHSCYVRIIEVFT
jgi:hypothetical protein